VCVCVCVCLCVCKDRRLICHFECVCVCVCVYVYVIISTLPDNRQLRVFEIFNQWHVHIVKLGTQADIYVYCGDAGALLRHDWQQHFELR